MSESQKGEKPTDIKSGHYVVESGGQKLHIICGQHLNEAEDSPLRAYAIVLTQQDYEERIASQYASYIKNWQQHGAHYGDPRPEPLTYLPWDCLVDVPTFAHAATPTEALRAALGIFETP